MIRVETPKFASETMPARRDWANITGKELIPKPPVFLHVSSGEYYCNIIGGIAYPVALGTEIKPGIVIIMGVQNDPEVKFRVWESYEDNDVFGLIEKALDARKKYGFGLDPRILPCFYGDQEKYQTLIVKTSEALERKGGPNAGLYIKDTVDLRERHSFPLYVRQLFHSLKSKRLEKPADSGDIILTGHLQGFQREDAESGRTENFPAVGLLGGMIHSLQIEQPWLEYVDGQGACFNVDI